MSWLHIMIFIPFIFAIFIPLLYKLFNEKFHIGWLIITDPFTHLFIFSFLYSYYFYRKGNDFHFNMDSIPWY